MAFCRDRGGANVTRPFLNQTFDQYLFEKPYKVQQRYPTPGVEPTQSSSADSGKSNRSILIGAVEGSIIGGLTSGIGLFALFFLLRGRNANLWKKNCH
jgi:hypothetical protein